MEWYWSSCRWRGDIFIKILAGTSSLWTNPIADAVQWHQPSIAVRAASMPSKHKFAPRGPIRLGTQPAWAFAVKMPSKNPAQRLWLKTCKVAAIEAAAAGGGISSSKFLLAPLPFEQIQSLILYNGIKHGRWVCLQSRNLPRPDRLHLERNLPEPSRWKCIQKTLLKDFDWKTAKLPPLKQLRLEGGYLHQNSCWHLFPLNRSKRWCCTMASNVYSSNSGWRRNILDFLAGCSSLWIKSKRFEGWYCLFQIGWDHLVRQTQDFDFETIRLARCRGEPAKLPPSKRHLATDKFTQRRSDIEATVGPCIDFQITSVWLTTLTP